MPSFDHVVTQWMSPEYDDGGRERTSSQVQLTGPSTCPSTRNVQAAVSSFGVGSAVRTGQSRPTSYCPGGRRGSRSVRRPAKPRVNLAMPDHTPPGAQRDQDVAMA